MINVVMSQTIDFGALGHQDDTFIEILSYCTVGAGRMAFRDLQLAEEGLGLGIASDRKA